MNKHLPLALAASLLMLFSLSSCKNKVNVVPLEQIVEDTIKVDSIDVDSIATDSVRKPPIARDPGEESLFEWNLTADTIIKTNRELVTLMDELYRYVRSKIYFSEKTNIDKNFQWMRNYRKKLCQYYDSHKLGPKNISVYAKADSVIGEIRRLWDIKRDDSTMGYIVNRNIEFTRQEFQLYNNISYMCSLCDNEEQQNLLRKSFEEGLTLQSILEKIGCNFVDLEYWGGSMASMSSASVTNSLYASFFQLYENEKNLLRSHSTKGISLDGKVATARKTLIDTCPRVLEKCYSEDRSEAGGWSGSEESLQKYRQLKKETQKLIAQLPAVLDRWIKTRQAFSQAVYPPELRKYSEQNTIDVLTETTELYN